MRRIWHHRVVRAARRWLLRRDSLRRFKGAGFTLAFIAAPACIFYPLLFSGSYGDCFTKLHAILWSILCLIGVTMYSVAEIATWSQYDVIVGPARISAMPHYTNRFGDAIYELIVSGRNRAGEMIRQTIGVDKATWDQAELRGLYSPQVKA